MLQCGRLIGPPVRYVTTTSGMAIPALRLRVRPLGAAFAGEDGFQVDTGCDVPLGLAPKLRNWLRSTGARPGAEVVEWGAKVRCEVYRVAVLIGDRWIPFEGYFPMTPHLRENLVGRPVLDHIPICLRPADAALHVTRAK